MPNKEDTELLEATERQNKLESDRKTVAKRLIPKRGELVIIQLSSATVDREDPELPLVLVGKITDADCPSLIGKPLSVRLR